MRSGGQQRNRAEPGGAADPPVPGLFHGAGV